MIFFLDKLKSESEAVRQLFCRGNEVELIIKLHTRIERNLLL